MFRVVRFDVKKILSYVLTDNFHHIRLFFDALNLMLHKNVKFFHCFILFLYMTRAELIRIFEPSSTN